MSRIMQAYFYYFGITLAVCSPVIYIFFFLFFLCVQLCLVMLADWLAQQVMGLLTQLLMAIGRTKEECL